MEEIVCSYLKYIYSNEVISSFNDHFIYIVCANNNMIQNIFTVPTITLSPSIEMVAFIYVYTEFN